MAADRRRKLSRRSLLEEQYGPLHEYEEERPPSPEELRRRRRILVGKEWPEDSK